MRPRPVVGEATVPDAVRRLLDKFDYPDQETPAQIVPILPTLGGGAGTGAFIHLTRNATQSIASAGEEIEWDSLGLQGVSGFTETVTTTTVTIEQAGYYNIAVLVGWSTFQDGGSISILNNGVSVWPPTDDPGLSSTTDGQFFEGTAPAIDCKVGDVLSVNLNPDDASAQTLASATFTAYLVDRAVNEGLYRELVLSHGPIAYWRLDETSGTDAADSAGHASGPFDGTYENTPTLNQTGVMQDGSGNPSVELDGSTERVNWGDIAALEFTGTVPFSVEAWVVSDVIGSSGSYYRLVAKLFGTTPTDNDGWQMGAFSDGSQLEFTLSRWDGTSGQSAKSGSDYDAGTPYHVVGTYDGTTTRIYVDGALQGSDSSPNPSLQAIAVDGRIGASEVGGGEDGHWNGRIDEAAIYDRELTAVEIQEHYVVGSR